MRERPGSEDMFTIAPRLKKRSKPAGEVSLSQQQETKFRDVRIFLVERKMGRSRRSFLTHLARSKGFTVEDLLRLEQELLHLKICL